MQWRLCVEMHALLLLRATHTPHPVPLPCDLSPHRSPFLLPPLPRREQEEREARKEAGLPPPQEEVRPGAGSFDSGDPHTTNLFIGNLAPDCDEQVRVQQWS